MLPRQVDRDPCFQQGQETLIFFRRSSAATIIFRLVGRPQHLEYYCCLDSNPSAQIDDDDDVSSSHRLQKKADASCPRPFLVAKYHSVRCQVSVAAHCQKPDLVLVHLHCTFQWDCNSNSTPAMLVLLKLTQQASKNWFLKM